MFTVGDRVTSCNRTGTEMPDGSLGTVTGDEGSYILVHFDDYEDYGTQDLEPYDEDYMDPDEDAHWVRPEYIQLAHQEVPYDPEQMIEDEDDF